MTQLQLYVSINRIYDHSSHLAGDQFSFQSSGWSSITIKSYRLQIYIIHPHSSVIFTYYKYQNQPNRKRFSGVFDTRVSFPMGLICVNHNKTQRLFGVSGNLSTWKLRSSLPVGEHNGSAPWNRGQWNGNRKYDIIAAEDSSILHCSDVTWSSWYLGNYTPRTTKLLGGILVLLRPSVRLSVRLSVPHPVSAL